MTAWVSCLYLRVEIMQNFLILVTLTFYKLTKKSNANNLDISMIAKYISFYLQIFMIS